MRRTLVGLLAFVSASALLPAGAALAEEGAGAPQAVGAQPGTRVSTEGDSKAKAAAGAQAKRATAPQDTAPESTKDDTGGSVSKFETEDWCRDALTICWDDKRPQVAGIRLVAEPKVGNAFQRGDNRIQSEDFGKLALLAVETNLWKGYLGFQVHVVLPATVTFDERSEVRVKGRLKTNDGTIHMDGGYGLALTFFDGILTGGWGLLYFDPRQITAPVKKESMRKYVFLNFQPVSTLRSAIKRAKAKGTKPSAPGTEGAKGKGAEPPAPETERATGT